MDAKTRPLAWGLLILAGAVACAIRAAGQDLSALLPEGVPGFTSWIGTQKNPDPAWQPLGIRAGTFTLFPQVTESVGYDSNALASTPPAASAQIGTHASLQAKSDWRQDQAGALLSIDNLQTPGQPAQARTDWTASAGGAVHFGNDALTLGFAHVSTHEDRTALDALPTDAPIPYSVEDLRLSYAVSLGRLTITPSLDTALIRYGEASLFGQPVPQAYRDRNLVTFGIAADYQSAPGNDLMLVARGLSSHYVAPQPDTPTRDSTGWEILGGIDERLDDLWRFRVLAGWQQRFFASSAFRNHGAVVAEADAIWSPTRLIDVTFTLSRTIEDAAQELTAAYVATAARLSVGYQWRRNIWLNGSAAIGRAVYLDSSDTQTVASIGGGVTWWLNRRINLGVSETVTALRGTAPPPSSGSYTRSVSLLSVGFGL